TASNQPEPVRLGKPVHPIRRDPEVRRDPSPEPAALRVVLDYAGPEHDVRGGPHRPERSARVLHGPGLHRGRPIFGHTHLPRAAPLHSRLDGRRSGIGGILDLPAEPTSRTELSGPTGDAIRAVSLFLRLRRELDDGL